MEKKEALSEIMMYIEQVKDAGRFVGRARLLKTLEKMYDLVDLYKPASEINEVMFSMAKNLMKTFQKDLDE
ncbi:hypothetical protein ES703_69983 [subsurface metagenome]